MPRRHRARRWEPKREKAALRVRKGWEDLAGQPRLTDASKVELLRCVGSSPTGAARALSNPDVQLQLLAVENALADYRFAQFCFDEPRPNAIREELEALLGTRSQQSPQRARALFESMSLQAVTELERCGITEANFATLQRNAKIRKLIAEYKDLPSPRSSQSRYALKYVRRATEEAFTRLDEALSCDHGHRESDRDNFVLAALCFVGVDPDAETAEREIAKTPHCARPPLSF